MGNVRIQIRANTKYIILLVVSVVSLVLDQWTKHLIHTKFHWGESRNVFGSIFALTYVRNTGAAFGLLNHAPAWFREPFFLVVPTVALVAIIVYFVRLSPAQRLTATALSLILSGALGNLVDRLHYGFVVDFLDFHWGDHHWPAFNVADSCIVVGVGLLFVLSLDQSHSPHASPTEAGAK